MRAQFVRNQDSKEALGVGSIKEFELVFGFNNDTMNKKIESLELMFPEVKNFLFYQLSNPPINLRKEIKQVKRSDQVMWSGIIRFKTSLLIAGQIQGTDDFINFLEMDFGKEFGRRYEWTLWGYVKEI